MLGAMALLSRPSVKRRGPTFTRDGALNIPAFDGYLPATASIEGLDRYMAAVIPLATCFTYAFDSLWTQEKECAIVLHAMRLELSYGPSGDLRQNARSLRRVHVVQ